MNSLTLRPVVPYGRHWRLINALAREAFPPEEYLPPKELVRMAQAEDFDFWVLTETEKDREKFIGFLAVQCHRELAYLFFLAISPRHRSQGYGGRALRLLREQYPGKNQVVDLEALSPTAPNAAQRESRRKFYLSNGYRPTELGLSYFGVDYEVLSGEPLALPELQSLMATLSVPDFHPRYFVCRDGQGPK